jgi:hypothetical protein
MLDTRLGKEGFERRERKTEIKPFKLCLEGALF